MTKGILLIALGRPQYGNLAANLAASIRYTSDIPIHVVYTEGSLSHLSKEHLSLFTSTAICPPEIYKGDKKEYIRAKTHMYDLSPFDETIFLDVDMVILPGKNMADELAKLSEICDFTMETRGYADLSEQQPDNKSFWCNVNELKEAYNVVEGRFYNLHSEFVFFKKCDENEIFFEEVKKQYDHPLVEVRKFDNGLPDEFAFSTAMMLLQYYPHLDNFIKIYWDRMDGHIDWNTKVIPNYIGFSLGGNETHKNIASKANLYNRHVRSKLNLPYEFRHLPKRQWNANRIKV